MSRTTLLLILMALPVLAMAQSTMYRWVDAQGRVHFSQTPPPSEKSEKIQQRGVGMPAESETVVTVEAEAAPPASTVATPEAPPTVDEINAKFLQDTEAANKAKAEAAAKNKLAKADAARKCQTARERMTRLDERTARRLATVDASGNVTRMDDDEFAKRKASAQKDIDSQCR